MAGTQRHEGRWFPQDRFAGAWHYLPAELPAGTRALRVRIEFARSAWAKLDLGLLGPAGFRGWSGGARREFVIAADRATPGYLPGELGPGQWQVMIGLHKLPPDGLPYSLTIETTRRNGELTPPEPPPAPPVPARPPGRALPAAPGRRWLAGDLHTHTVHSDGALTVPQLAALAAARGLDFLAITDHNTISHHAELPAAASRYGIILLPGQELTADGGHAGALGDIGWVDFRDTPDDWLDAIERNGGLMSVNHPIAGPVSWTRPMRRRPPLAEVWHWSWLDLRWTNTLAWWLAWDPAAIPVGGSDWHRDGSDAPPGQPVTWVECEGDDQAAVLRGLRAGRVAISATRDGPVLLRHDGDLVAISAEGLYLYGPNGPCARVSGNLARFPGEPGHHRLADHDGETAALTP